MMETIGSVEQVKRIASEKIRRKSCKNELEPQDPIQPNSSFPKGNIFQVRSDALNLS